MRLVMMGTGTFAEPTFEALLVGPDPVVGLVTQPDRAAGEERGSTRQTGRGMKTIAAERGVPVFQPERINTPEGVASLKALQPDLLVVAAYGQILSPDVLAVAPHGGINVHASLLPRYRGAAPVAWAIYHGEKQTGVTIIQMTPRLDAGGMLAQEAVDIGPEETAGELETRLAPLGARLAVQTIRALEAGTARPLPQDASLVSKAPKIKKENGRVDWTRAADRIPDQVRAMQPWPTAYTYWLREGKPPARLLVLKTRNLEGEQANGLPPGTLLGDQPLRLRVAAGDGGVVEVLELQPAGKRRMLAADFLRGHQVRPGDRLGPDS
jgi:methionyl-tRNA formyltransferase